jgi:hypothetical protein
VAVVATAISKEEDDNPTQPPTGTTGTTGTR